LSGRSKRKRQPSTRGLGETQKGNRELRGDGGFREKTPSITVVVGGEKWKSVTLHHSGRPRETGKGKEKSEKEIA